MTGTPFWACWLAVGLSAGVLVGVVWLSVRRNARAAGLLADSARGIAAGELPQELQLEPSGQFGALSQALIEIADRLRDAVNAQRQLEADHAVELEQRDRLVEMMIRTGRVAATATGQQELAEGVAEQLAMLCPRYRVGLYLLEDAEASAVLYVEAGASIEEVSAHRQRVAVGDGTSVGQCLAAAEARVWPETIESAIQAERGSRTGTRSEVAVPLRSRERVLGAISVYSDRLEGFDPLFVSAMQATADQLACALEYLHLAQEVQEAQAGLNGAGTSMEQAWKELLRTRADWGYRYADGQVERTGRDWPAEMREALATGHPVIPRPVAQAGPDAEHIGTLAMPLRVRDRVVGVLGFRKAEETASWTRRETQVLELLVAQLGDALVGAQLYEAAQSDAAGQQIAGELSSRMRQTLDVEAVLRTAVSEVREALGLSEVVVRLRTPAAASADAPAQSTHELRG
ncbi:MAG TPA: GAF domain-containing protein [Anaerolineae bacterium]|nr:GAF domain-containing protein [Anaerolineae bacterium]